MSLRDPRLIVVLLGALSLSCGGSPTEADGVVTITQTTTTTTTSTTTTTIIPALVPGAITTSPTGLGLVAATVFGFRVSPSGGVAPYSVAWDFGDGSAGTGATASHLYANSGTFTATATISDSGGRTAQVSRAVTVRTVTGRWALEFNANEHFPKTIDLVQNGPQVLASLNEPMDGLGTGSGSVSNPRALAVSLTFAAALPAPYVITIIGELDDTLLKWEGTFIGYPRCPCDFTATRPSVAVNEPISSRNR